MRTAGLFLSLLILLGTTPGQGQLLREGAQVRISSSIVKGRLVVVDMNGETLVLQSLEGGEEIGVPLASVRRLRVYQGPRPRGAGALRRGGFGVLIGAVVGVTSGLTAGDDDCDDAVPCFMPLTARQKAVAEGVGLGIVGGALGLLVGAVFPGDRWESVDLPIGVEAGAVGPGGFAVTGSLRL